MTSDTMVNEIDQNSQTIERPIIDINVIFDIYGEKNQDIVQYALTAFYQEASKYVAQLYLAVERDDEVEASRFFHSLKTMSAMIGAREMAKLCDKLQVLSLKNPEFELRYTEFQQLWPLILIEMEQHLVN